MMVMIMTMIMIMTVMMMMMMMIIVLIDTMLIDATVSCTSRRENPKLDRRPDNENENESVE